VVTAIDGEPAAGTDARAAAAERLSDPLTGPARPKG